LAWVTAEAGAKIDVQAQFSRVPDLLPGGIERAVPMNTTAVTIVALTEDPSLLEALRHAAIERTTLVTSPSADRFVDQIVANAGSVVLVDAAAAPEPLDSFIAQMRTQFPGIVLMIAGGGHLHTLLAPHIADGNVFRFVHKPASAQRLKLFIDAALHRRELLLQAESATSGPARLPARRASHRIAPLAGVAVVVLALLALGGAWLQRRVKPSSAGRAAAVKVSPAAAPAAALVSAPMAGAVPTPPTKPSPMPAAEDPVLTQMLVNADSALAQGKLVAADGGAAGDLYRTALLRSPYNERAQRGLSTVLDRLLIEADRALGGGRQEEAAQKIDVARKLQPDNAQAARLSAQLARQREAALLDELRRTASGAKSDQAHVYLQLVRKRMAGGALLEPEDDSARGYLSAAVALAPDDVDVDAAIVALGEHLVAQTRKALIADDSVAAERWLAACQKYKKEYAIEAATIADLTQSLQRLRATAAAIAPAPMVTPAPAVMAAPAVPAAATGTVSEGALTRVHFIAAVYPQAAEARGITGWVELEFTVTADGAVRDIAVVAAQPDKIFDKPAIEALAQWRYKPLLHDGLAVEQRAHLRMRFTL